MNGYKVVFWDFDGVIKDSVRVKSDAYLELFRPLGTTSSLQRIRVHNDAHGGMSRFDKVPLYLGWSGHESTADLVNEYCERYARLVRQAVIDAPWVPGAEALLRQNPFRQVFVLVSATPQGEIEHIVGALQLRSCFKSIHGAPQPKARAIGDAMAACGARASECLMIGDASADRDAALANDIAFLLRRHDSNADAFAGYAGPAIKDFSGL